MVKPSNQYQQKALEAAERLDRARAAGDQLTFLPDETPDADLPVTSGEQGRPKGAKNKVSSQMRDWLAAKGYQMPETMLAQMAGLGGQADAVMTAMATTERLMAWIGDGQKVRTKLSDVDVITKEDWEASPAQRLATFMQIYTIQLRAADALLPYGAGKVTPDASVSNTNVTQIIMPAQTARPGDNATVIDGHSRPNAGPPPMPKDIEQNQEVTKTGADNSDAESRTE